MRSMWCSPKKVKGLLNVRRLIWDSRPLPNPSTNISRVTRFDVKMRSGPFVTEGNLGVVGNRLVGDQASGEWAKEDSEDLPELIELWVALRDGRTGQAIEGPFYFRATEEP